MAKPTDQTLEQIYDLLVVENWNKFLINYNQRFSRLLYLYLTEKNNGFSVVPTGPDSLHYRFEADTFAWAEFVLPVNPPKQPDQNLESNLIQLEQALELHYETIRLQKEQNEKRIIALAKLTAEERQLLKL